MWAVRVGLEPGEIERLGAGGEVLKCAAADLGWAAARGADGTTTVSGTVLATAAALADAAAAGVSGKALTPWLLASVTQRLGERALAANHALLLNNARVGARLATAHFVSC